MDLKTAKIFLQRGDIAKIAEDNGFNKPYLYQVFNGKRHNLEMKKAILKRANERRTEILSIAK